MKKGEERERSETSTWHTLINEVVCLYHRRWRSFIVRGCWLTEIEACLQQHHIIIFYKLWHLFSIIYIWLMIWHPFSFFLFACLSLYSFIETWIIVDYRCTHVSTSGLHTENSFEGCKATRRTKNVYVEALSRETNIKQQRQKNGELWTTSILQVRVNYICSLAH